MKKERIEKLLGESQFKEMITTQLISWELSLKRQELSDKTIERKIKNILAFYTYLTTARTNNKNKRIKADEMNSLAFEFVRDGLFSDDNIDNDGSKNYRENIYYNIMTGINYIHESYFKDRETIINPLTDEQREVLEEISHNKFYRFATEKENAEEKFLEDIQLKILKELGVKLYFDDNKNAYVYSHELSEVINIQHKHIRDKIGELIEETDSRNFDRPLEHSVFNVLDDTYLNSQNKKQPTYKIYKDMLILYFMEISAQKDKKKELIKFKMKYIDAFNFAEIENKRHIEEKAQLKKAFYDMYNEIRKRNRDLLVSDFNKKVKSKKKAV